MCVMPSPWEEKVLVGFLPMFLCSSAHLKFPSSMGTGVGNSCGLPGWAGATDSSGFDPTFLERRARAGKRPSAPFSGLQGLLFILLEGNRSTWISEAA